MTLTTYTTVTLARSMPSGQAMAIQHTDGQFYAVVIAVVRGEIDLPPSPDPPPAPPPTNSIDTLDQRGPFATADEAIAALDEFTSSP